MRVGYWVTNFVSAAGCKEAFDRVSLFRPAWHNGRTACKFRCRFSLSRFFLHQSFAGLRHEYFQRQALPASKSRNSHAARDPRRPYINGSWTAAQTARLRYRRSCSWIAHVDEYLSSDTSHMHAKLFVCVAPLCFGFRTCPNTPRMAPSYPRASTPKLRARQWCEFQASLSTRDPKKPNRLRGCFAA